MYLSFSLFFVMHAKDYNRCQLASSRIYIYILFFFSNIKISKHQTSILVIRDSALSVSQILHSPYNKLYSIYGEETKTEVTIFQLVQPCLETLTSISNYNWYIFFFSPCCYLTRLTGNIQCTKRLDQESDTLWSLLCRSEVASTQVRTQL